MSNVVTLSDWRPPGSGNRSCPRCGGEWFRLKTQDDRGPAVVIDDSGAITGYTGVPTCAACDDEQQVASATS